MSVTDSTLNTDRYYEDIYDIQRNPVMAEPLLVSITGFLCFFRKRVRRAARLFPSHEHARRLGVMMVEEEAVTGVKSGNSLHFIGGQLEVEDVDVLFHAFDVG